MNPKFRIFKKKTNEYVYLKKLEDIGAWFVLVGMKSVKDIVIQQFTGAKDVKGVDIYDGDRIVCKFQVDKDKWNEMTGTYLGTVKYDTKRCMYCVFYKGRDGRLTSQDLQDHWGHEVVK